MIRGTNKYVIDVCDTGNQYYERAILFLKPQYADAERDALEKEAKKLIKRIDTTSSIKKHGKIQYLWLKLSISALFGAILSAGILSTMMI